MTNTIVVRSPILPLCINDLIKKDKLNIVNKLIEQDYSNELMCIFENKFPKVNNQNLKYYLRGSYRTTDFNGMVNEYLVIHRDNEIYQKPEVKKLFLSDKQNLTVKIGLNPFVYKYIKNFYIIFTSKSGVNKIEGNFFIQSIVNLLEKKKYTYKNFINTLVEIFSLSEEVIKENIDELLKNEFLLMYNRKLQEFGNTNGFIKKNIVELSNIDIKDTTINNLESVMRSLLSNIEYIGYDQSVNYFIEEYGNNLISLEILSKDNEFIKNILSIKSLISSQCKFITIIKEKQKEAILMNKQFIEIDWKEMKKYIFSEITESSRGFDLFFHLYSKNNKDIIDIDTGHNIYNFGKSHYLFKTDADVIEYNFFEDNIWYLSRKNKTDDIKIISDNFSQYYIGVNENNEFFVYDSIKNETVNLITKNNLNMDLYPIPLQLLLICSNKNNLTCNIRNLFVLEDNFFTPEVRINNIILNKKTWNFTNLKYMVNSFKKFSLFIENLLSKGIIPPEIVLFNGDVQSLYNLKVVKDLKFIYSQIKKDKEVIFKENLQEYSMLCVNNLLYANQCIMSFPYKHVQKNKYSNVNLLNIDRDITKDNYYTVTLTAENFHVNEDLHKIKIELLQKLNIKHYFWINYRTIDDNFELRLRVRKKYIPDIISEMEDLNYKGIFVKIEKYNYEFYRYYNLGEIAFKKLSIYDSYFYDYIENNSCDDITRAILNTQTWLKAFYGCSLNRKIKVLEKYNSTPRNSNLKKYCPLMECDVNDIYEKKINKIQDILMEENIFVLSVKEIQSLIHISNNRVLGTRVKLEKEIYKEILVYLKRVGYSRGVL